MVQNHKLSVSALQNEQHKKMLTELLRQEGNRRCADCHARGPSWASVNLGVFMCLNCSGVHRSLGVHISKVRSTNLDTWLPEQVAFVQAVGNVRGNAFWEANLPSDFRRPPEADMSALRTFINNKYASKLFCPREFKGQPPSIENYATHPFLLQLNNNTGAPTPSRDSLPAPAPAQHATSSSSDLPPVVPMPRIVTTASQPPPEFDLLSLDDGEPTPANQLAPLQHPSSMGGSVRVAAASAAAAAAVVAPATASWDPFMASPPTATIASSLAPSLAAVPVTKQPSPAASKQQDPFDMLASMDRAPSSSISMASSSTISSTIGTTTVHVPAQEEILDPFAYVPAPAPAPPPVLASYLMPPKPPVTSSNIGVGAGGAVGNGGNTGAIPRPSAGSLLASGPPGPPAMRANSGSSHTKGSLSHDDILAMFDKPSLS